METDFLYSALAHENLYDCIRPAKKEEWETLLEKDCDDSFGADPSHNFCHRTRCSKYKKHDKREPGLFRELFRRTENICLCSKTYCCYNAKSDKYKFSSKGLNKKTQEETGDGTMETYRRVMDEIINLT